MINKYYIDMTSRLNAFNPSDVVVCVGATAP